MKIFRLWGIIVFLIIVALLFVFFKFFFDGIGKTAIEKGGSQVLQRPVEIKDFKSNIFSFEFTIDKLQIADTEDPMKNVVSVDKINFNVNQKKLLAWKKYQIENMLFENISFFTKREKAAKIKKKEKKAEEIKKEEKRLDFESFTQKLNVPSAKEIIEKEHLKTIEVAKQSEQQLKQIKQKWEKIAKEDFPKEKQEIQELQKEIKQLEREAKKLKTPQDYKEFAEKVKKIKKEIDKKIKRIKQLKKELEQDKKVITSVYPKLKEASKEDIQNLKQKYSLSLEGGLNLAETIFGKEIKEYLNKAIEYYKIASPYLKRGEEKQKEIKEKRFRMAGKYIEYKEFHPYPDFVIKNAKLSLNAFDTKISGKLKDYSDNQKIYGKPLKISFNSKNGKVFKTFDLDSVFDRTTKTAKDSIKINITGLKSKDYQIKDYLKFTNNKINVVGDIEILNEKQLKGFIKLVFGNTKPVVLKQDNAGKILSKLFSDINKFYVSINLNGEIESPNLKIKSDLDEMLSKRLRSMVKEKVAKLNADLQKQINQQKLKYKKEFDKYTKELEKYEKYVSNYENQYKKLLKESTKKLGTKKYEEKLKQKLKEKLKFNF
jgi:uncharacterized protein (TIGR03545 family)